MKMNLKEFLYFAWVGFYGRIMTYLKQHLFQGQDILRFPLRYLKDLRFMLASSTLLFLSFGTWIIDAIIRQKLHLSEMYGYASLISTPFSIIATLLALKLSEEYLADKIQWWAVAIWIIGIALSMIGASYMIKR